MVYIDDYEVKEGSMKLVNVGGKNILLAKYNGEVFGVSNQCSHMGCSLAMGKLNGYIVTCPCHGWSFDIRTGQSLTRKNRNLVSYECKIDNGKLHVKLLDDV